MSDELTNHQVSADIWTLYRDSIPSPWMKAVFLDHGIPMAKYGQCWEFPLTK